MIDNMCITVSVSNVTHYQLYHALCSLPISSYAAIARGALEESVSIKNKSNTACRHYTSGSFNLNRDKIRTVNFRVRINSLTHAALFEKMQTFNKKERQAIVIYALSEFYNIGHTALKTDSEVRNDKASHEKSNKTDNTNMPLNIDLDVEAINLLIS